MIEAMPVRRFLGRKTSVLAVLVLALGMGTSVAFFSVADSVLYHPLPVKHLDWLVVFSGNAIAVPGSNDRVGWWEQAPSLAAVTTYQSGSGTLRWGDRAEPVLATVATPQFFRVFGVQPILGRGFVRSDQRTEATGVAVLSHDLWVEGFGSSRGVVGQDVSLDGTPLEIVGVAPARFHFPGRTDLWIAQQSGMWEARSGAPQLRLGEKEESSLPPVFRYGPLIGRLKPRATLPELQADLRVLNVRMRREYDQEAARENLVLPKRPPRAESFLDAFSEASKPEVILLFGASLFLLVVSCLNAGNLLLAHSAAREREMAIRQCLGATPLRIAKQMLGEGMGLACVGGALGVGLAWWGVALLRHAGSAQIPGLANARVLPAAIAFALTMVLLAGFVSGIAPALDARSVAPSRWLGGEGQILVPRLASRARKAFVAGQIALAFALIAGAAVTAKTLHLMLQTKLGFDPNGVVAVRVVPSQPTRRPETGAAGAESAREVKAKDELDRELLERLREAPGAASVGLVDQLLFGGATGGGQYIDARGKMAIGFGTPFDVAGDYFRTLRIPLLAGSYFSPGDNRGTVIINERLASLIWGDANPIGRFLSVEDGGREARRVIGVVGDVRYSLVPEPAWKFAGTQLYLPMDDPDGARPPISMAVVVRTAGKPANLLAELDGAVASVDPGAAVYGAVTMNQLIGASVGGLRFRGLLLGFFALAAVVLGLLGVYGVASFAASRRTREFALRMALGARPGEIVALAVREAAVFVPAGIAVGVGLTFWMSKLVMKFLPGTKAPDLVTMVATGVALLVMAVAAELAPALRVGRVHPSEALRDE